MRQEEEGYLVMLASIRRLKFSRNTVDLFGRMQTLSNDVLTMSIGSLLSRSVRNKQSIRMNLEEPDSLPNKAWPLNLIIISPDICFGRSVVDRSPCVDGEDILPHKVISKGDWGINGLVWKIQNHDSETRF